MRKQNNGKAIVAMIIIVVAMIILGLVVSQNLPESLSEFSSLIFWGIIVIGGGIGSFLCGRFLGK